LLPKLGYDGLEIAPFHVDEKCPFSIGCSMPCQKISPAALNRRHCVSGLQLLLVAPDGLSITDADPATQQRTNRPLIALVSMCAALGGGYLHSRRPRAQTGLPDSNC